MELKRTGTNVWVVGVIVESGVGTEVGEQNIGVFSESVKDLNT